MSVFQKQIDWQKETSVTFKFQIQGEKIIVKKKMNHVYFSAALCIEFFFPFDVKDGENPRNRNTIIDLKLKMHPYYLWY